MPQGQTRFWAVDVCPAAGMAVGGTAPVINPFSRRESSRELQG